MADVKADNELAKVKEELKAMQDMFRQLTEEEKSETYDARRTYMLKAQIIQLERQCMLFSDALSSRASTVMEIENELIALTEQFQSLLAQDVRGPTVPISKKQLISHIHTLQKLKGSMHKQSVLSSAENLYIPQISGVKFCKTNDITCFDVCNGKIDHLNLQHVARLESKLVRLFTELTSLQTLLKSYCQHGSLTASNTEDTVQPEKYLFSPMFEKVQKNTNVCIQQLEDCCQDLICLSLLHPSAPWSVVSKPNKFGVFDSSVIISGLPSSIRHRKEVKGTINSICKAHSYLMHVNNVQLQAMRKEMHFCNQICLTYGHYVNSLIQGVTTAYDECETSLTHMIKDTIDVIVKSWLTLKEDQSEDALKNFMSTFKIKERALQKLVDRVSTNTDEDFESSNKGLLALKEFGSHLKERIACLQQQCAAEAAKLSAEIDEYTLRYENELLEKVRKLLISGSDGDQ